MSEANVRRCARLGRSAGAALLFVALNGPVAAETRDPIATNPKDGNTEMAQQNHIGMWVTADGHVRQELLPNGRYDEARGNRKSAYQGRYTIIGNRIEYVDDTGFTADGEFIDGVLHHGGMIFYREK